MAHYKQGLYVVKHPEKYMGDVNKVRFMSSWELETHKFFDNNPNVLNWGSECVAIPYIKPTDGKIHKYYPDYFVHYRTRHGELKKCVIEVKPIEQTRQSRSRNPRTKLYEDVTYAINLAKWDACTRWCESHGYEFKIITQKTIFR